MRFNPWITGIIFGALLGLAHAQNSGQFPAGGGGGGGTPGGSSGQLQYNNAGAFGGANLWVNSANTLDQANGVTAQSLRVYNTTDSNTAPVNYERGVIDWTATANTLTIGTRAGGTGTVRNMLLSTNQTGQGTANITMDAGSMAFQASGTTGITFFNGNGANTQAITLNSSGNFQWNFDTSLSRAAAAVVQFGAVNGAAGGWMQWGGQARVTADVTQTSTTTLANVTGLTVNVQAGRTYSFEADLSWTDAAAGGIQAAIGGTATATNIIYDGWIIDSAANGIKGNAQATALGGAVANAATTGTAGHLTISGTITVNAAGTLTVQSAQSVSNATSTTIKRGSRFLVYDMP